MQRLKLLGSVLAASCLLIGTVAAAEPVSPTPPAKKHAECEGSKVKTACNNQADVKEFVTGRQVQTPTAPAPTVPQTSAAIARQALQPAQDAGAAAEQPK